MRTQAWKEAIMRTPGAGLPAALLLFALALAWPVAAFAQAQGKVRIAQQFGLSYLPLHVALELKLIEKHARVLGEADATVEVVRLASGTVAMAGLMVLLNLHDKTVGQNAVKGMMATADRAIYFNTTDPRIKAVKDFGMQAIEAAAPPGYGGGATPPGTPEVTR